MPLSRIARIMRTVSSTSVGLRPAITSSRRRSFGPVASARATSSRLRSGKVSDEKLVDLVRAHFKLTPKGIIDTLKLRRPVYRPTAAYGHFGREEPEFTWEATTQAAALRAAAGL